METKFNVFEILQIAEQIEHKGARFYLKTAELFGDPALREIYYNLANWKAKHEQLWARMKKRIAEKTGVFGTFDPTTMSCPIRRSWPGSPGLARVRRRRAA